MTEVEHLVLCEGGGRRIWGVRGSDGVCGAEVFIIGLPVGARLDFRKIMDRLVTVGRITNTEVFRRLQSPGRPPVWEMKSFEGPGYRLYCIQEGTDWWVTHGSKKPKDRRVGNEVARARDIFAGRSGA